MGVNVVQGEGEVLGVCSPFSQWEMPLRGRRWNVSDSYAYTSQHFRSANISSESSIRGLVGDIFSFKIKLGVYEKLRSKNVTIVLRNVRCKVPLVVNSPQKYPFLWTDPQAPLCASSLDPSDLWCQPASGSDPPFYHNALDRPTDRPTDRWWL